MTTTCLDKMTTEEEVELTPQMKKMKLNSCDFAMDVEKTLVKVNFRPEEHIKLVFPKISEEVNNFK